MKAISRRGRNLTVIAIIIAVGATLAWHYSRSHPPVEYLTVPVIRGDVEDTVLATGVLQPSKEVAVGAQVSGQLKSLKVDLGDTVKTGQWLAQIDPVILQNALSQAHINENNLAAQKRSITAQIRQATLTLRRQEQMLQDSATSHHDFEAAQTAFDIQRANLQAIEAQIQSAHIQIDTARTNLAYARIVAPMDGEVVAIMTQQGQTVIAEQQAPVILKLADLSTMTVKAQISEADVARVHPGQTAYFTTLGDSTKRYYGTLHAIEPAPSDYTNASNSSSQKSDSAVFYNAIFNVQNPDRKLRIAMTAQVNIVLVISRNTLMIPVAALGPKEDDETYAVRTLGPDGTLMTRRIKTGINNHVNVEILSGLKVGDAVVTGDTSGTPRVE